jgi:hypothetical protein
MSTPTPSQSSSSSDSSGGGSDIVNYTALVVALVALVVSALQLILQYVLSAGSRSKCSSAAIGHWSKRNRQYWEFWKGKLSIKVGLISHYHPTETLLCFLVCSSYNLQRTSLPCNEGSRNDSPEEFGRSCQFQG